MSKRSVVVRGINLLLKYGIIYLMLITILFYISFSTYVTHLLWDNPCPENLTISCSDYYTSVLDSKADQIEHVPSHTLYIYFTLTLSLLFMGIELAVCYLIYKLLQKKGLII